MRQEAENDGRPERRQGEPRSCDEISLVRIEGQQHEEDHRGIAPRLRGIHDQGVRAAEQDHGDDRVRAAAPRHDSAGENHRRDAKEQGGDAIDAPRGAVSEHIEEEAVERVVVVDVQPREDVERRSHAFAHEQRRPRFVEPEIVQHPGHA